MSMSKEECLHDCTCCATGQVQPPEPFESGPFPLRCDLPEGHATGTRHWDPAWGFWSGA